MTTPRQLLGKARMHTFEYVPYLASHIYSLRAEETRGLGTACVDANGRLYYDPEWIASIDVPQCAYLIAHEALHLVFEHHKRGIEIVGEHCADQRRYILNLAADLVIEQTLALAGMRALRPEGGVHLGATVPQLGGLVLDFPQNLSMGEYYRLITEKLREQQQSQDKNDSNTQEKGADDDDDDDGEADDGDATDDGGSDAEDGTEGASDGCEEAPASGKGTPTPQPGTPGGGGSCADGQPRPYEVEDDGSWDAYASDIAAARAEQEIAAYESSGQGKVPGAIKQALSQKLRPQPDPFDQLRSAVCSSVASPVGGRDFSHRRLSRKQPDGDDAPLLHGRICVQPRAVVIVDTSGSMMDTDTQAKALSVIGQGLRKLGRVKVICADTHVRSHQSVVTTRAFEWAGGGGTNMARAIEDVERSDKPDSIILITDAITGWPSGKPRARVVVAYTGERDSRYHHAIPSWARTVVLNQKGV